MAPQSVFLYYHGKGRISTLTREKERMGWVWRMKQMWRENREILYFKLCWKTVVVRIARGSFHFIWLILLILNLSQDRVTFSDCKGDIKNPSLRGHNFLRCGDYLKFSFLFHSSPPGMIMGLKIELYLEWIHATVNSPIFTASQAVTLEEHWKYL